MTPRCRPKVRRGHRGTMPLGPKLLTRGNLIDKIVTKVVAAAQLVAGLLWPRLPQSTAIQLGVNMFNWM